MTLDSAIPNLKLEFIIKKLTNLNIFHNKKHMVYSKPAKKSISPIKSNNTNNVMNNYYINNAHNNVNININNNKAKTSRENPQNLKEINIGLKHSYWNQDFNATNDQFKVDNNFENINNLDSINQKLVLVNFKFEGIYHPLKASKQIKMGEVCERFAEIKNRKISYFKFLYQGKIIDQNKKVGDYFDNDNIDGITIIVEDNKPCYVTHKTKLIAIGSVVIGIIILAVILIVSKVAESKKTSSNNKTSKTSYSSLIDGNLINNTDIKISNIFKHNDSVVYFKNK